MYEKEVYVIKTCKDGKPHYDVLSLEQPEDANAAGLKLSLENAIKKAKFSFNCCEHEIGLGSDGTNTNKRLYELEKEDVGDHLCLILCLNHKLELAVHNAFQQSSLNEDAEKQLVLTYYSSKKANLKWHLFKRHAITVGESYCHYKRPSGTRWVAHQSDALDSFLSNLACLLGYLHNQISDPYNAMMTKEGPRLEGVLSDCSDLVIVFQAVKIGVIRLIKRTSLIMEKLSLILPEAIATINVTLKKIRKLKSKLEEDGIDALKNESLFPMLNMNFLPKIEIFYQSHSCYSWRYYL